MPTDEFPNPPPDTVLTPSSVILPATPHSPTLTIHPLCLLHIYVPRMALHAFSFLLFALFLRGVFSALSFPAGGRVAVPLPSVYQPDFVGRAFLISSGAAASPPGFRVALSVEAFGGGGYSCALVVLLGDVKVWASDHVAKFLPADSCVVELTPAGDLQLSDQAGRIGWRTGTLGLGVQSLHLRKNTGNLVLTDGKNRTKWQSFNDPSNAILRGQRLNSWARLTFFTTNSSPFYSFEVQQDRIAAYLNWRGNKYSYWEFKPPTRSSIAFISLGSKGLRVFDSNSSKIAEIKARKTEKVRFLALDSRGNLGLYYYSPNNESFEASYRALDFCNLPLPCGLYGICSSAAKSCSYLQVAGGDYSTEFCDLSSSAAVEMAELEGIVTVLRTSSPMVNSTKEECLKSCLKDCACAAILHLNGEACFRYGLVGGARDVAAGEAQSSYWVKVRRVGGGSGHGSNPSGLVTKVLIVGAVVDGVALCVVLGGLVYYFMKVRKRSVVDLNAAENNRR